MVLHLGLHEFYLLPHLRGSLDHILGGVAVPVPLLLKVQIPSLEGCHLLSEMGSLYQDQ